MASVEIQDGSLYTRLYYDVSQNISANTSTVRITRVEVRNTAGSEYQAYLKGTIKIDSYTAVTMSYSNTLGCAIDFSSSYNGCGDSGADGGLNTGWSSSAVTVSHNADGSKDITFAISLSIIRRPQYTTSYTASKSKSVSLSSIPRVSTISASAVTLGSNMTISISRASTSLTTTLTYSCGSVSGTIASKSTLSSVTWEPPVSLSSQSPNSTSVSITITGSTYSGSTLMGSNSITVVCAIPATVVPTLDFVVSDSTSAYDTYGGYIQNQSVARVVTTANGAYNSTIRNVSVICGRYSSTGSNTTIALPNSGEVDITVTVTDSRNRVAALTKSVNVIPYEAPTGNVYNVFRCNESGESVPDGEFATIMFTGKVTPLSDRNTAEYAIGMRTRGGTGWTIIQRVPSLNNVFDADGYVIVAADKEQAYEICVLATDNFGTRESLYATIPVSYALLDFNKANKAIGIGQRASAPNTLNIGLNIKMFGNKITDIGDPVSDSDAVSKLFVLNAVYPIGSVYFNIDDVSPQTILGGIWEKMTDGFSVAGTNVRAWKRTS